MMTQFRSQEQLLHWIDMVSLMLVDLTEYLDPHPCDRAAIDHFNHYQSLYKKAMREYADAYGPLTLSTATPDKVWCWGLEKNPWERRNA